MAHGFSDNKEKVEITDAIQAQVRAMQAQISALQSQVNTVQTNVSTAQTSISNLQTNVNAVQRTANATQSNLNNYWKTIYPIGSIYMSISATNPGTLVGGTWVAWGSGRVPVGVNTSDGDFNTVEKMGGEKKHTLTVNEIPSHYHGIRVMADNDSDPYWGKDNYVKAGANSQEAGAYTEDAGGGQSHNNLQPYITCYMFKRIA